MATSESERFKGEIEDAEKGIKDAEKEIEDKEKEIIEVNAGEGLFDDSPLESRLSYITTLRRSIAVLSETKIILQERIGTLYVQS